jgi:hypothetical protein
MKRLDFAAGGCGVLVLSLSGGAMAQGTGTSSLDMIPKLIEVRSSAENDLKQVHNLAQYMSATPSPTASPAAAPSPIDLPAIDSQYDDLVAAINGYLEGLSAAIMLPRPLDDQRWKTEGSGVIAQAQNFDSSLHALRKQYGPAGGTRGSFLTIFASVLQQIILPGSNLFTSLNKTAKDGSQQDKQATQVVLKSAEWRDAKTVLGPPPSPHPQAS